MKMKAFYCHIDSFCGGLPNIGFFNCKLTSLVFILSIFPLLCHVHCMSTHVAE